MHLYIYTFMTSTPQHQRKPPQGATPVNNMGFLLVTKVMQAQSSLEEPSRVCTSDPRKGKPRRQTDPGRAKSRNFRPFASTGAAHTPEEHQAPCLVFLPWQPNMVLSHEDKPDGTGKEGRMKREKETAQKRQRDRERQACPGKVDPLPSRVPPTRPKSTKRYAWRSSFGTSATPAS